jgi:carbamoyltransferase
MYVLGLTTLGDAAASLTRDGEIVAAAEEERFSRQKHHIGFPYGAVRYCLDQEGITLAEVNHVGHYWKPWILRHKAIQAAKSLTVSRKAFAARVDRGVHQISRSYLEMLRIPSELRRHFGPATFKFHYLEHHLCHAASAFYPSPYERAAILTFDGTGEAATTLFATGEGSTIRPLRRITLPHSLGQFYSTLTNFLGFDMFQGDEWKVMGLAAYGKPTYREFLSREVLLDSGDGRFYLDTSILDHHLAKRYQFSDRVVNVLGPPRQPTEEITERHCDIAASAQRVLEDVALSLLSWLKRQTGLSSLCLAGGVAFNSVMNGRIIEESPFDSIFIQPAAGDAGCSLGAAWLVHHRLGGQRPTPMTHAYYGPAFSGQQCVNALQQAGLPFEQLEDHTLLPRVAQLIADGAIVGWFQGRMEFGPRALGSRSFLADPRRSDMRALLNKRVKLREWFRPLAPSIMAEAAGDFFHPPYNDPFMVTVHTVSKEARDRIPAVVHVDGTARPQMVSYETSPRYWTLLSEFARLTGVPVLLNTSFNVQEPIVCSPEEAISTFTAASFDALVLEDCLVLRSGITG